MYPEETPLPFCLEDGKWRQKQSFSKQTESQRLTSWLSFASFRNLSSKTNTVKFLCTWPTWLLTSTFFVLPTSETIYFSWSSWKQTCEIHLRAVRILCNSWNLSVSTLRVVFKGVLPGVSLMPHTQFFKSLTLDRECESPPWKETSSWMRGGLCRSAVVFGMKMSFCLTSKSSQYHSLRRSANILRLGYKVGSAGVSIFQSNENADFIVNGNALFIVMFLLFKQPCFVSKTFSTRECHHLEKEWATQHGFNGIHTPSRKRVVVPGASTDIPKQKEIHPVLVEATRSLSNYFSDFLPKVDNPHWNDMKMIAEVLWLTLQGERYKFFSWKKFVEFQYKCSVPKTAKSTCVLSSRFWTGQWVQNNPWEGVCHSWMCGGNVPWL